MQAHIINVEKLFELAPDELEMGFNETRRVNIALSRALDADLSLNVCSQEDASIADVLSPTPIIVSAGDLTASFEVGSFEVEGETEIVLCTTEGDSATLEVEVEGDDDGDGEEEHELELKWAPGVIKAAPEESRIVRLLLKYGVAAEDLKIVLTTSPEDLGVILPDVLIPAGENSVSVVLEFTDPNAAGTIIAALDGHPETEPAELEIELKGENPGKGNGASDDNDNGGGPPDGKPGKGDDSGGDPPGDDDEEGGKSAGKPGKGDSDDPGKSQDNPPVDDGRSQF